MHRIDSEGHDNNRFVDEDANQAIAGTTLAADWLNAIQEELINILVLAGIDPLKVEVDQLAQAFNILGGSKDWADITNKPTKFPSTDAFGTDQTLQTFDSVTRESGETYTNSTTRTIQVLIQIRLDQVADDDSFFYINDEIVAWVDADGEKTNNNLSFMIPPNFTYKLVESTTVISRTWKEIR